MRRLRVPVSTEEAMQIALHGRLTDLGYEVRREVTLSGRDRIDFVVGDGIGIECKIKGPAMSVMRQMERYAESDRIKGLILFTSFYMKLPDEINGKPARTVSAGMGWL